MKIQDPIDIKILSILKEDSRLSNKEIGTLVHRTGQAVGSRIAQLNEKGIIAKYSVELNYDTTQFIRVMMQNNNFEAFEKFTQQFDAIEKCYKVCGSACYMLIAHFERNEINPFIEQLSTWGQYSVDNVVRTVE